MVAPAHTVVVVVMVSALVFLLLAFLSFPTALLRARLPHRHQRCSRARASGFGRRSHGEAELARGHGEIPHAPRRAVEGMGLLQTSDTAASVAGLARRRADSTSTAVGNRGGDGTSSQRLRRTRRQRGNGCLGTPWREVEEGVGVWDPWLLARLRLAACGSELGLRPGLSRRRQLPARKPGRLLQPLASPASCSCHGRARARPGSPGPRRQP